MYEKWTSKKKLTHTLEDEQPLFTFLMLIVFWTLPETQTRLADLSNSADWNFCNLHTESLTQTFIVKKASN